MYAATVLGAGINGLCTAFHLARRGVAPILLLEQFESGHSRGSSHGKSRITRSTYHAPCYVELMQVCHGESWPELEAELGRALRRPCPGCFFGPGVEAYLTSLRQVQGVESLYQVLSPDEARSRFPAFRFSDSPLVVLDHSAAVVAAEETISALWGVLAGLGVEIRTGIRVEAVDIAADPLRLLTESGPIETRGVVITAGAWAERLWPALSGCLRVARQQVGYLELDSGGAPQGPPDFPVWVYVDDQGGSFYGLPQFQRPGLKVARHQTGPRGDDPDLTGVSLSESERADLHGFVEREFAWPLRRHLDSETCLYTNTADEHFILDRLPQDPRIVIGAGFSGHGFKFGPLTGRILAELYLDGRTQVEAFERHRQTFALSARPGW